MLTSSCWLDSLLSVHLANWVLTALCSEFLCNAVCKVNDTVEDTVNDSHWSKRKVCLLTIVKDAEDFSKLRVPLLRAYTRIHLCPWMPYLWSKGGMEQICWCSCCLLCMCSKGLCLWPRKLVFYQYLWICDRLICLLLNRINYPTLHSSNTQGRSNSAWNPPKHTLLDYH